jgi:hypothetical protein
MPFYNLFVDWAEPLSEAEQCNRLEYALEQVLDRVTGGEYLIMGTTSLSTAECVTFGRSPKATTRSRVTFQSESVIGAAAFKKFSADGVTRIVFSPIVLSDSGFPLLGVGEDAVEVFPN